MKLFTKFGYVLGLFLSFYSCSQEETLIGQGNDTEARFICTNDAMITVEQSRSTETVFIPQQSGDNVMQVSITESPWRGEEPSSRGGITGDELDWIRPQDGAEQIAIYIAKNPQNGVTFTDELSNMAYNPYTRLIRPYGKWTESGEEYKQTLVDVDDFIKGLFNKGASTLSFYGYTIRPSDKTTGQADLYYKPTSVVSKIDESNLTNKLVSFSFTPFGRLQTDENIYYHDLMYCIGETKDNADTGRYGNQNMPANHSIQMHFRHAFTLLNFTINKGNYRSESCIISGLKVNGSLVYDEGVIDLLNGMITPDKQSENTGGKEISREISPTQITASNPYKTGMIVIPVDIPANAADDAFKITCKIDGIDYSCSLKGVELKSGFKYNVNLTINPPGETILNLWDGLGKAEVINGSEVNKTYSNKGQYIVGDEVKGDKLKITPANGYVLSQVRMNNQPISIQNNENEVEFKYANEGENVIYDVIFVPSSGWYAAPGNMTLHLDGKWNDRYNGSEQQLSSYWHDLSGSGNDGVLNKFNLSNRITNSSVDQTLHKDDKSGVDVSNTSLYTSFSMSGWDGKGLKYDGVDDIVSFTSDVNGEFTMEFYVCVEKVQVGQHPRFNAEPSTADDSYPAFYFAGTGNQSTKSAMFAESRGVGLYGLGIDAHTWNVPFDGNNIFQLDFVYKRESHKESCGYTIENGKPQNCQPGTVYCYINGASEPAYSYSVHVVPDANSFMSSLGNRIVDNSRGMNATFYSYIIYDKALSIEEISQNFDMNTKRFGTTK